MSGPGFTDGEIAALRKAHAQAVAYHQLGRPAPPVVALLERLYQQWRKRVQRERVQRERVWQAQRRAELEKALREFDGYRRVA